MTKSQLARECFLNGANCAQAVLCAFAEECQLDETSAMRLASGFGGGMGRMREVCGAVSGMILVANILRGNTDPKDKAAKDKIRVDNVRPFDNFLFIKISFIKKQLNS